MILKKHLFTAVLMITFFSVSAQNWNNVMRILASDRAAGDYYGWSADIDRNFAVVGAYAEQAEINNTTSLQNAGAAYILKNIGGTWTEIQKITQPERHDGDYFGYSVSISGDYIVIGANGDGQDQNGGNYLTDAGAAYVYKNNTGNWTLIKKITPPDRQYGDNFGRAVSIDGSNIAVGAYFSETDQNGANPLSRAGSAYIFQKDLGGTDNWGMVQKIIPSDRNSGDYFGIFLALSGNDLIVSSLFNQYDETGGNLLDRAGAAFIFNNTGGSWQEVKKIVAADRGAGDYFGQSVAISGDYAVVGATFDQEDQNGANPMQFAGSAYIFKRNQGGTDNWGQLKKILPPFRSANDMFGFAVSISGDRIAVGAIMDEEDQNGQNPVYLSGSCSIFNKNTGGTDNWGFESKIIAGVRTGSEGFGTAVAIDSLNILVGAYQDANGKPGQPDYVSWAGAAHLFSLLPGVAEQADSTAIFCENADAVYTISGIGADSFRWQVSTDGGIIFNDISENATYPNTSAPTLSIFNISAIMAGYQYRCILTNTYGEIITEAVTLSLGTPPHITLNPVSQTVSFGTTVLLTSEATGSGIAYRWEKDGQLLSNAGNQMGTDTTRLIIQGIQEFNLGTYRCLVSGTCGQATSTEAVLSLPVGYTDLQKMESIISPNPSSGIFTIALPYGTLPVSMKVYDISGNEIFNYENPDIPLRINLSEKKAGTYVLKIKKQDRQVIRKLLIKQ